MDSPETAGQFNVVDGQLVYNTGSGTAAGALYSKELFHTQNLTFYCVMRGLKRGVQEMSDEGEEFLCLRPPKASPKTSP